MTRLYEYALGAAVARDDDCSRQRQKSLAASTLSTGPSSRSRDRRRDRAPTGNALPGSSRGSAAPSARVPARLGEGSGQLGRVLLQDRIHRVDSRVAHKGLFPRENLVKDCPEGEDVGSVVNDQSPHLFGRRVADRAQDGSRARSAASRSGIRSRRLWGGLAGEAEVEDLDAAVLVKKRFPGFKSR